MNLPAKPTDSVRTQSRRPGWLEIFSAAVVYVLCYLVGPPIISAFTQDAPVPSGIALAALSGVMGLLAFFAAYLIRIRDWPAFGVRAIPIRWVWYAIGFGVLAYTLVRIVSIAYVAISGSTSGSPQGDYTAAANGGALAFTLQLICIAVVTPLGEEFAFRGVLATAFDKYGARVSIAGSTVVFALAHGINLALIPAIVVGAINGILRWRTKSVWPGVIVHAVNNAAGTVVALLLG